MSETRQCVIQQSYADLRSLYFGGAVFQETPLKPGRTKVLLSGDDTFSVEGTLSSKGFLSGMAKLYERLDLKPGAVVGYSVTPGAAILITSPLAPTASPSAMPGTFPAPQTSPKTVFQRMGCRYLHIEPFRPENLNNWEPETETDVYLAFGVLQDFTDFQYCCGASKALLGRLAAKYDETSKPDAILIDRKTDEYLVAEWKKRSSDFKDNHRPDDVDVLVCWTDDEIARDKLPSRVLALYTVARTAAESAITSEQGAAG